MLPYDTTLFIYVLSHVRPHSGPRKYNAYM